MSNARKLHNLNCWLAEDIMSLTDEELLAEAKEDGVDVDAVAERGRAMVEALIEKRGR